MSSAVGFIVLSVQSSTNLPPEWFLPDIGLAGLVTLFVILVLTGRLVPKSQVDQWRTAYETERNRNDILMDNTAKVHEGQKLMLEILQSLRAEMTEDPDEDVGGAI